MTPDDLKNLKKLIEACRKMGVSSFKGFGFEFLLNEKPKREYKRRTFDKSRDIEEPKDPYENFPDGELTPEQLMFYSAGGLPENDPHLKGN